MHPSVTSLRFTRPAAGFTEPGPNSQATPAVARTHAWLTCVLTAARAPQFYLAVACPGLGAGHSQRALRATGWVSTPHAYWL
jgi:hypothetical protein